MARHRGVSSYRTARGVRYQYEFQVAGRPFHKRGFETDRDAFEALTLKRAEAVQGIGVGGHGKTFADFWEGEWIPRRRAKVRRGSSARERSRRTSATGGTTSSPRSIERGSPR